MEPTPKHDQRDRFHSERELAPLREEKVAKSALAEGERGRHRPGTRPDGRFPAGRRRQRKQRASYLAAARAGDPVSPNNQLMKISLFPVLHILMPQTPGPLPEYHLGRDG